jgi:hypothetical protein
MDRARTGVVSTVIGAVAGLVVGIVVGLAAAGGDSSASERVSPGPPGDDVINVVADRFRSAIPDGSMLLDVAPPTDGGRWRPTSLLVIFNDSRLPDELAADLSAELFNGVDVTAETTPLGEPGARIRASYIDKTGLVVIVVDISKLADGDSGSLYLAQLTLLDDRDSGG